MPRQEKIRKTGLLSDCTLSVLFLAVAFFCVSSWAVCSNIGARWITYTGSLNPPTCSVVLNPCSAYTNAKNFAGTGACGDCVNRGYGHPERHCQDVVCCGTQAEADSAYCARNPDAEECKEEDVPPSCEDDYSRCVSMGGVWKKVGSTSTECSSECNLCGDGAMTRVKNAYVDMCCDKGMAPPGEVQQCYTPAQSGPGMSESVFNNKYNDWSCGARTTADGEPILENQELYKRFCLDGERYEEQLDTNEAPGSSSSGGGASSSEGIGHSFGTELEALGGLYGVLDTIRDTLVKRLTPATEKIYDCLLMGTGCTGPLQIDWTGMPSDSAAIDSAIKRLITPYLDSSVRLDSAQLKALRALDTNMLKMLKNDTAKLKLDSAILKNDSTTRRVLSGAIEDVNDTTRKWLNRIADSIGVSTDSLLAHLDSIRKTIPDSILDSISKYQSQSNDYLDSILNAPGKGFTKLDSSIDSAMKYFIYTLNNMPYDNSVQMGYALGYGDTATSNLRKDLEDLKGTIQGIGTGFDALGDSIGYLRGDLEGYLTAGDLGGDSGSNVYDGAFGDTLGDGWLSDVERHLGASVSDSAFEGVFPSIDSAGEEEPTFDSVDFSLNADSLYALLQADVDSSRSALEDTLEAAFDTLRDEFQLINFDSMMIEPLGMRVPNTNTCPEHCFTFSIEGGSGESAQSWLGSVRSLNFPLCNNLPGMSFNVFILLRLIARIFVSIGCIYIAMWFIAGRRN